MKRETTLPFLAGLAVATAFFVGLGATRDGANVQKVMLVDGQGNAIVGQGRYLPVGTANGNPVEIRSAPFGLQVQGLK